MKLSNETVRQAILATNPMEVNNARFGPRVAKKLNGMYRSQPRANAPMNRVYFDNTQADIYVIIETTDGLYRKMRPWLTVVVDDFTGMVVGFALSLQAPKADEVLAALRHTTLPKAYSEQWVGTSLTMVWEAMGIPDEIVVDNGLDLQAHAFYGACQALGISVTTCPPMEPWRKGRMERVFGTLNTKLLHRLSGSTFGSTDNTKKNEYDPQNFACLTLDEFLETLHITFEEIACSYHKGMKDIPIKLWRQGVRRFPLRMPTNLEEFNAQVSLRTIRTIGRLGIEYKGLHYADEKLVALRRTLGTDTRVTILIKPEDLREIYVVDPATQTTVAVACTQKFDEPLPLFLYEAIRRKKEDPAKNRYEDGFGAEDAQAAIGTLPSDHDFRADALQRIDQNSRARLNTITTDKSTGLGPRIGAIELRQRMESPREAPDHRAASILRGREILNMAKAKKTNDSNPDSADDE